MGRVERIWLKRAHRGPMDSVSSAMLDEGRGVRDSANYGGRRHVTIIASERWLALMDQLGGSIDPSARRANVMVSGVELENSHGRHLTIGGCTLLIAGETRPCERMEEALTGLQEAMRSRWGGGAWAEVVRGGSIAVGDDVQWETTLLG